MLGLLAPRRDANDGDDAALGGHIVGGLGGVAAAEDLEGVVGAATAGELADLPNGVLVGGVDGVSGAEAHGELELGLADVDGDDLAGVGQGCAHDDVEAHAAAADDGYGAAGLDLGAVDGRADAGGDGAADHCGLVHGDGVGERHHAGFGDDGVLGEAGHLAHVVDVLAVGVEARGAVKHVGAGGRVEVAEVAVALEAGAAASAGGHERQDDLVAFRGEGHARAGLDDGAGALVSEDDGDGDGGVAVHEVAVAAADAGGTDFHQDFAGLRLIEVDFGSSSFYLHNRMFFSTSRMSRG